MTPSGLDRLKLDEGLSLTAYPDPITKDKPWTIGYGYTGPGIVKGMVWTEAEANGNLLARVNFIAGRLRQQLQFFKNLSPVRQDVLVNIAYNIGIAGLLKWTITLAAIGRGDFIEAAKDIRTNKVWSKQVGKRVNRCADALEQDTWTV